MDPAEAGRQCAFYDELDAIFKQRDKFASQMTVEGEQGQRRMLSGNGTIMVGSEEESEDDTEEEADTEEERKQRKKKRKRMTIENSKALVMQEVLADFFHRQQKLEETWRQDLERREQARRVKEEEWREAMQRLEEERLGREREWREREEMRRAQEDARAEKRDQLFAALIAKLTQGL
ncbi:hypothetical protein CBR_g49304 [Chara braunii]|uniref:Uncharacterized protein n=1 Tax=Chara braunii TaxID=69332 RepID=A0A388M4V5_CHABU|nr:hypothetical protein CBR_g49304 [Chara braunii]|eukprot:GBG89513.1 hypothetical protein CBR_g49304 [Chara braunii]